MDDGRGDDAGSCVTEASTASRRRRIALSTARLVLGLALLVGLFWLLGPDWGAVAGQLRIDPVWLGASLVFTAAATFLTAGRWQLLNERMTETRLSFGTYVHYIALTRLLGQFSSMLLMDFIGRGVALRAAGSSVRLARLLTPVLLERLLDLVLPAALLGVVLVGHRAPPVEHPWLWLTAIVLALGVLCVPTIEPMARVALKVYLALRRLRHVGVEAEDVRVPYRTAVSVSAFGVARLVAVWAQFWAMGMAAGAVMDPLVVACAMPIAQLSALLSITPGGLGIQDAGWAGGLRWLDQDESTIALFLLAWHTLVIVNFAALSLVTWPWARTVAEPSCNPAESPETAMR